MGQRRGTAAILAAAAACLLLAGVGAYGLYAILDEDAFADRATRLLSSDEMRQEVAARIASRVVEAQPALAADEAAVEDVARNDVTDAPWFQEEFRAAAVRMQRALLSGPDADAALRVEGSGGAMELGLERLPGWGDVPTLADPWLTTVEDAGREHVVRTAAPLARDLTLPLTIAFGMAGLALLALGISSAASRRRGIWAAGITVATAGGLLAAGITGASDVVLDQFDTGFGDAVASQVWNAYVGDLRLWALGIGATGLVVAAAAGGPPLQPFATPTSSSGRLLRASALLALAGFAVALPEMVLHIGLVTLAAALVYVAAGELLKVLAPPECSARLARAVVGTGALLALIMVATVAPA